MNLYEKMGARYFLALGNHHDNFDCWDSKYQPWTAVKVGPHQDIVGIWEKVARKHAMPFGIGFHSTPARTWGQFMPQRYRSDKHGDKAGIPYDAMLTKADGYELNADGTEKWWKGMDPQDLYGPVHHNGRNSLESPFANQFMWRVDDAIRKYQPDMIYFDDHAGDSQVDLGINMGLGKLTADIITNFYNIASKRTNGNREVVATFKGVGGRYNSFQNHPEMVSIVDRSLVKSTELYTEDDIMAFPFQTEVSLQDWHYQQGGKYRSAEEIVTRLMQNVSRNGCLLLNIPLRADGTYDEKEARFLDELEVWMKQNGESIFGTRPWVRFGEGPVAESDIRLNAQGFNDSQYNRMNYRDIRFNQTKQYLYVTAMGWPEDGKLVVRSLAKGNPDFGKSISSVYLLGYGTVKASQTAEGLVVTLPRQVNDIAPVLRIRK